MKCQVEMNENFRHILLFEFNKGVKAAEAARNICSVYGDNAIGLSTARKWFSRFREEHFDLSDCPRSGSQSGFDKNRLLGLMQNNPWQSTRELASVMNCDQSTITRHMQAMDKEIRCVEIARPY